MAFFSRTSSLEEQAAASEDNMAQLALAALDAGYALKPVAGGAGEVLSPEFCRLFGFDTNLPTLEAAEPSFDPAAYAAIQQAMQQVAENKQAQANLTLALQHGAQHVDIQIRKVTAPDDGREWLVIWARDVSKSRRDLHRLQQENSRVKQDLRGMGNLLNALPIPIWMRQQDQALKYCNLAYMEAAEMNPESQPDIGHMELHRHAAHMAQQAWDSGQAQRQRRHFVYGGQRRYFEFNEIPSDDRSFSAGYAMDYTELETLQEELERHVSAQRELLESSASGMAIFGADKRLKFYNNAYVKLWKMDEAWLATQPSYREILEVLRENRSLPEQVNFAVYRQEHLHLFTDLLEPHEEFYYLPDGRTLRVLAIPHALGGLLFAYEDVTDRLALERSYNTLIAVQRATLDHLHEAVAVIGENGRLQLTNPPFLELWGLEAGTETDAPHIGDILDRTRHLYAFEEWGSFKQEMLARFHQRSMSTTRIERTDGRVLDLLQVPLPDGAALLAYLDVTDSTLLERSLRQTNEALEASDRLKTEFLANVSYELRSPLTSISGFAQMLNESYFGPLNDKQREYVQSIHQAALQLSSLINDMLDIAGLESGNAQLLRRPTSIDAMLAAIAAELMPKAQQQQVALVLEKPDDLGEIAIDELRVRHSLTTLVATALRYTESGNGVAFGGLIRSGRGREELVIWVEERLSEGRELPMVDEEGRGGTFYRLSASGFRKSGAGLSLSMVKSYIQLHGGHVDLETMPGGTTRVVCVLPR